MEAVDAVPVVGQPLAYGIGFAMLLFVVFTDSWARSLVTVAHESGHMVMAVVTFRGHKGFELADGGGGGTELVKAHWSIGDLLTRFAGYPLPPLIGLGGAVLVRDGHVASVLWVSAVLLLAALFQAANPLAKVVTFLALAGTVWAIVGAGPEVQAATAVGLVWWMLIGGAFWSSIGLSRGDGSDAYWLARRTLVPRIVWHAAWAVIGIACLWSGGRALLGY